MPRNISPRRKKSAARLAAERLGNKLLVAAVVIVAFAATGLALLFNAGVMGIGSAAARGFDEQIELISTGDCALRNDGTLVGRVVGTLSPTRGQPRRRFQVAMVEIEKAVSVYADEIRIVPCSPELLRSPAGLEATAPNDARR